MKGFICLPKLFGEGEVVGFGEPNFYIKKIDRSIAYDIIIRNHYAKKGDSLPHNKLNFGLFINEKLVGCLQFGLAMNARSCSSIVKGTEMDEYFELNRMWIDDTAPRNTESRALSYCIKTIKKIAPKVNWIQSFADERCGKLGIVYQAANFQYFGFHTSIFWEIEGETYHNSRVTNGKRAIKYVLQSKMKDAKKFKLRQFRYIYIL
jgi:hypothetical protein